jgi:hypothetical protein
LGGEKMLPVWNDCIRISLLELFPPSLLDFKVLGWG